MIEIAPDAVIIALDPATTTGYAIGAATGDVKPFLGAVNLKHDETDTHADIFGRAFRWIAGLIEINQPALFAIEPPVPPGNMWGNSNYNTTALALGFNGIFIGAAAHKGVAVLPAPIFTWRKHFLGPGNAKLERAKAKLAAVKQCRLLGWSAPNDDAAEAGGIWDWARGEIARQQLARRGAPLALFQGDRE